MTTKFYHGLFILEVPESVYYPREDSLLIAKHIPDVAGKKCLDMGCGSGFLAVIMAKKGGGVTAADINPEAVEAARRNAQSNGADTETVQSDLFSSIPDRYDFIAFNAPYLPGGDGYNDAQWSGGIELIEKFMHQLPEHLERNGKALIVFSSLTGDVQELAEKNGFLFRIIAKEKIPWEELILAEIKFSR